MRGRVRQRARCIVVLLAVAIGGIAAPSATEPVSAAPDTTTGAYVPVGPIRLADTRRADCGCTRVDRSTIVVDVASRTGVDGDVIAAAITVTATPTPGAAFVTAYPAGTDRPGTSTLNTRPDRVVANSTIVPLGDGAIEVFRLAPGEVIVDVTGVWIESGRSRSGRFIPLPSDRILDTRTTGDGRARLDPGGDVTLPLPRGVDADAVALAVNVTSIDDRLPGNLSARPAGTRPRETSFLNTTGSGQVTVASIVAPVSTDGFTIRSSGGGDVIVDVVGWFTGPSASRSAVGLFRPRPPERLLDTRERAPRLHPGGAIELPNPIEGAAALVTNVTVTQADRQGFVTAHPAGTLRPATSTINPAEFDHTVANLAITRVSERGLGYWSLAGTDLVVDVTGSFTGNPVAATRPMPRNDPVRSRVLMVGDSTLAALDLYTDALGALRGFDAIVDAQSCRRLMRPSCHSRVTNRTPNTGVEAILTTPGNLDIVVIKAGYNDWFSDFPVEFDAIVRAARAKGAHTILWFTQNETVRSTRSSRDSARRAYIENNVDLRWLTELPQYPDVVLADWLGYSDARQEWFFDGTHTTRPGTWAISDYTARWIAALEHRACPRPWVVGGPIDDPCPPPDRLGAVPDPVAVNL